MKCLLILLISMGGQQGNLGFGGEEAQFLKLKILESYSLDANGVGNKLYLSTKADDSALEKATIIDLIYNPLYVNKIRHISN